MCPYYLLSELPEKNMALQDISSWEGIRKQLHRCLHRRRNINANESRMGRGYVAKMGGCLMLFVEALNLGSSKEEY